MSQAPYVRLRTRDLRTPTPFTSVYVDTRPNPDITTVTPFSGGAGGIYREMTDTVTPDWQRIKGNGGIVSNPMHSRETITVFQPVAVTDTLTHPLVDAGKITVVYAPNYPAYYDLDPAPLVNNVPYALRAYLLNTGSDTLLSAQAAVKARNKVNPILVQSLVSLAELHKTVRLVTDAARTFARLRKAIFSAGNKDQIFDLINGVRRGEAGRAGRFLLGASTRYLEYRYGWRILMMEIQSALKALDKTVVRKTRATARGRASSFRDSVSIQNLVNTVTGTDTYTFTSTENVEARAWVLYEADLNYQSSRDWGLTEVPLAAWELIPFSFVVDWFIPIGNWLEAITPKVGIKVLSEGVSVKTTRVVTRKVTGYTPAPSGTTRYARTGLLGCTDTLVEHTKVRTPSLTQVLFRPYVDVKLNVARVLDAIALLVVAGRGRGTSIRR